MSRFASISDALDLLVEPCQVVPDWDEILRRATPAEPARRLHSARSRRRLVFATVLAAVAVLVAAAFASGLADRFSSWVNGTPGRPASSGDQSGFAARNRVSLAAFPAGTKLRLLLRQTVGGTSFDLLGFRSGDAYCLRLVRTARPGAPGSNQCLRADELRGHVALVADNAWFRIGDPEISITGVYGFASDQVKAVRVSRTHGISTATVTNNVFLALAGQPTGTVRHHPQPNTVFAVTAEMQDGSLRNIPYVVRSGAGQSGLLPKGKRPTVPSYFAAQRPGSISGAPTRITAPIAHPRVGWLDRRENRGSPLPAQTYLTVTFGRVIQPDPDDPERVGVAVGPAHGMTYGHPVRGRWTCLLEFDALRQGGGAGCRPDLFADGPIALGSWLESPITHFNGLVADGIVRVRVFLSTGQQVPAALRDNVFTVAVPQAELPGEVVGYNRQGQVAAITQLQGNAVAKPCPPAEFTTPAAQLPAPAKWERLDLATLTVAGQQILGKTPAQVQAILGRPTMIRPRAQQINSTRIPEFRYGGSTQATLGLSISFGKRGSRIVAVGLYYQAPSLVEAKLGNILRLQPTVLQQRIERSYGGRYRLALAYGGSQLSCSGSFRERTSATGFSFGLNPYRPSRPYLQISTDTPG